MAISTKAKTKEEYDLSMKLYREGNRIKDISEITGINRSTISNWINARAGKKKMFSSGITDDDYLKNFIELSDENLKRVYSFIFGLYLGDGCIYRRGHSNLLAISLDKKHTELNEYIYNKLNILFQKFPYIYDRSINGGPNNIVTNSNLRQKFILFPQHGRGMKCDRTIELVDWQKQILDPIELLKGLIYSDGSFISSNGFNSYRYEFSNCSTGICDIFISICNSLGIKTAIRKRKIQGKMKHESHVICIAHQDDVRWLMRKIGNKYVVGDKEDLPEKV